MRIPATTTKVLTLATAGMLSFGAGREAWGNSAPVVSNVTASQRADWSKLVDICYDLADADGDACTVSVQVSNDAGATWTVSVTALTGAVGPAVTPGVGKLIVWECRPDLPGVFGNQYKVKVCADDGYNHIPPGMALIPAGEFQMGDTFSEGQTNERPVHAVYVDAFYMDTCEVTNQQYADALNWAYGQGGSIAFIDDVVYMYNSGTYAYCDTTTSSPYSRITWNGSTFGVTPGKENHPMVMMSWYGVAAYANWRSAMQGKPLCYDLDTWECNWGSGYRLPTEAEWEKAARGGGAGHRFPWPDCDTIQHARANYDSNSGCPYDNSATREYHPLWGVGDQPYTSPVGFFTGAIQYKTDFGWPGTPTSYQTSNGANGYGLYDIAGNVWEWCNDWYDSSYYTSSPYNNPHGPPTPQTYRVVRGGSWLVQASSARCAFRAYGSLTARANITGFRLALTESGGGLQPDCEDSWNFVIDNRQKADLDLDGDVDGFDFLRFSICFNGSNKPAQESCVDPNADLDGDNDVDGFDFLTFSNCFNGSNNPPRCP